MRNPEFSGTLAEALAADGRMAEATINGANDVCERESQAWCLPELRRIKGEIVLARAGADHNSNVVLQAEDCFQAESREAGDQGAQLWDLRAATSLARPWRSGGKGIDAARLLTSRLAAITEAEATNDLSEARLLFASLHGPND